MPRHGQHWNGPPDRARNRIPRGLRGRDIGLYFKNRSQTEKKVVERVINLKLPGTIITAVQNNVQQIKAMAKDLDIEIIAKKKPKIVDIKQQSEEDVKMNNDTEDVNVKPGTSMSYGTNYALPENTKDGSSDMIHIEAGDYKYGYKDIITGTFEEKLEESLSKALNADTSKNEMCEANLAMHEEYKRMIVKEKYKELLKFREILPAYKKSKALIETITNNQVIVISGETGCGKSTQVPQIILDDAIKNNRGANVKILVTQPRRIAASSLAMRVAQERAENLGNSVGYAVRLERTNARQRGSIMFCTTGILLAELEVNQGLTGYSHVILDEVHERDCHIDIAMCMLKKVLNKRKDLKLILMSATIDSETLSEYYDNCPMIHIEGLAYPVKDVYLEEILEMTQFQLAPNFSQPSQTKPWHKHTVRGKHLASKMEQDIQYKAEIAPWLESKKKHLSRETYTTLQDSRIEELNVDLIYLLVTHLCRSDPGAILVFVPGISEITKLLNKINESNCFPSNRYEIYPLHSKLPSLEQHKIFQRPPDGVRKIIIATNIAETSITIDDVVYVIDCAKIKYSGLNVKENVTTLKVEWVAQANLRQRRGRAGRCQPGICYHLLSSFRAQKLEERLRPELQRSDLLEPVLAIKRLRLGKAEEALQLMPSPPAVSTIRSAVKHLQQCGALDDEETLTPLGWHLARLPVHPAAGKLLLLGALFGCLDRAASVAAVWGFKDPFMIVMGKEQELDMAKRDLALGEPSDHVAVSEAIIQWEQCSSYHSKKQFAFRNFISMSTIQLLSDMKKQLCDNLRSMGFLTGSSEWENRNADNLSLFKAIIAASLYPNIATVRWVNLNASNPNKVLRVKPYAPDRSKLTIHPSSVLYAKRAKGGGMIGLRCNNPGANWLVYWLKQQSSELFILDVTLVYTLPLLFFGELNVSEADDSNDCFISISDIKVRCKKETTQLLFEIRHLLDQVLASKISGSTQNSLFQDMVLNAVIKLITAEDVQAEYLGDDDEELSESDSSEYNNRRQRR